MSGTPTARLRAGPAVPDICRVVRAGWRPQPEKKSVETVAAGAPCRDFVAFRAEESWLNPLTFFVVYA
jgi:hypothetical protein